GNHTQALTQFTELLNDRRRILGPDHPSTRTTQGQLRAAQAAAQNGAGSATTSNAAGSDLMARVAHELDRSTATVDGAVAIDLTDGDRWVIDLAERTIERSDRDVDLSLQTPAAGVSAIADGRVDLTAEFAGSEDDRRRLAAVQALLREAAEE
ncbi:MAG: hypothetical protein AAGA99_15950, partial [Actinomycetota bacterium]